MAKMTMDKWEGSAADEKADRAAKKETGHWKEGSAADEKADRAAIKAANEGRDAVKAHNKMLHMHGMHPGALRSRVR